MTGVPDSEGEVAEAAASIAFVADHMPLLGEIRTRFERERPFESLTMAVRIHIEAKTAVLIRVLQAGGARITALGNQGTTRDDVAEVLRRDGIEVLGRRRDSKAAISEALDTLAAAAPQLVLDNGAEVIERVARSASPPRGATEETTSGAIRLRNELAGRVGFPVIVINDSPLKAIVENKHGVGQSFVQVLQQVTNLLLHGKLLVVIGYGWCGRGIALYARRNSARVVVVEIDPVKALEAAIDGFEVGMLEDVIARADVVVTATGAHHVVTLDAMRAMKPLALLANAGHFDDEIDVVGLRDAAGPGVPRGPSLRRYSLPGGPSIDLVAEGQMMNLAAEGGRGNAIEIMDLGFALQALSLERLALHPERCTFGDQPVPADIDRFVAARMTSLLNPSI